MNEIFEAKTAEVLKRLGIKDINPGATTGTKWLDTKGDTSTSFSPVDGNEIAKAIIVQNKGNGDTFRKF